MDRFVYGESARAAPSRPTKTGARPAAYRYPPASLVPDGLRALAGLAFTGAPLALLPVSSWFGALLAAGVVLFGSFGALTAMRVRTRVRMDEDGIETAPGGGRIRWAHLKGVKLRYFAIRREREPEHGAGRRRGWMQLVLAGNGGKVRIDSRLDGFDEVLRRASAAASDLSLDLDRVTRSNLEASGIALAEGGAGAEAAGAGVRGA